MSFAGGVNENAADDDEVVGVAGGNRAVGRAVGDRLGDACLSGPEHLDGLLHSLDRHLRDQHGRRLGDQVGRQHGQQIGVTRRLIGESIREGGTDRAGLGSDQQVDVGDLVSLADKGLTDIHDDVAGHGVILRD